MKKQDLFNIIDTMFPSEETPFEIGRKYLIRTTGQFFVGKLVEQRGSFIKLEECYVCDNNHSGWYNYLFKDAVKEFSFKRLEEKLTPIYPDHKHWINTNSIVDFFSWDHE